MNVFGAPQDSVELNDLARFNAQIDSVSSASKEFATQHKGAVNRMFIKFALVGIPSWIIAGALFVFLLPIVASSQDSHMGNVLLFPLLFALLPFGIPFSFYGKINAHMEKLFNQQVGTALGLTYSSHASLSTVQGYLFSIGTPSTISRVFSGTYRELPLRLFTYTFSTGSGKSTTFHPYTCCEMRFPGKIIELFVIGQSLRDTAHVTWQPSGTHPLRVEGGLNDLFDVYVQDNFDIEGLQILEPNIILALEEKYTSFGFECSEDRVIIFTQTQPDTKEEFKNLMSLADTLYDKLIPEVAGVANETA
ncbi:MAG: hypothetical protein JWN90_319 [Parcubacteria group bacterium]|nr:hypothetical protein [Parcubacteria group bacterium]